MLNDIKNADLLIEKTSNTPEVVFYSATNEWVITGRSYPKDPFAFYEPVMRWFTICESVAIKNCAFQFKLEFFNTSSSKVLFDILIRLKKLSQRFQTTLSIKWHYEEGDDDVKEAGEAFMEMTQMQFELVCQ